MRNLGMIPGTVLDQSETKPAKRVLIEGLWRARSYYNTLVTNPPLGYEFLIHRGVDTLAARLTSEWPRLRSLWYQLQRRGVPVNLIKVHFDKLRPLPAGVDLIWAIAHLVLRRKPWILDLPPEVPGVLVGPEWDFPRYKRAVKRVITSKFCRRIITSTETGKNALIQSLDNDEELERKVEVVCAAVAKKEFRKNHHKTACRLLFVNSANLPGQFDIKGGKEALEAFKLLRQRYRTVELVVRSEVPHHVRQQYDGTPGLTFIEETLPWAKLESEFLAADIFLLPTHFTPLEVFLDAMSYELPVVTTDVWGNRELVEDGRTGFLVPKSSLAPDFLPDAPWGHSGDFDKVLKQVDPEMVDTLVRKIAILVENPELRRSMGRAGRIEVEEGRFSISRRNGVLKRILDEATGAKL